MADYKCCVCSDKVTSPKPPDVCGFCGTIGGEWENTTTGKRERSKPIPKKIPPLPPPAPRPKPKPKPKAYRAPPPPPPPLPPAPPAYVPPPVYVRPPVRYWTLSRRWWDEIKSVTGMVFSNFWKRFWTVVLYTIIIAAVTLGKAIRWPLENFLLIIPGILVISLFLAAFNRGRKFAGFLTLIMSSVLLIGILSNPLKHGKGFFNDFFKQEVPLKVTPKTMYLKRNVFLRDNPSMNAGIKMVMFPYNKVTFISGGADNWMTVDYYGNQGWMYDDTIYYSTTPIQPICSIVEGKNSINLRNGPSMNDAVLMQIRSGEPLTCLETSLDGKWALVRTASGTKGWIWKSYLNLD